MISVPIRQISFAALPGKRIVEAERQMLPDQRLHLRGPSFCPEEEWNHGLPSGDWTAPSCQSKDCTKELIQALSSYVKTKQNRQQ